MLQENELVKITEYTHDVIKPLITLDFPHKNLYLKCVDAFGPVKNIKSGEYHLSIMKSILYAMYLLDATDFYSEEDKEKIFDNLENSYICLKQNYVISLEEHTELKIIAKNLDEISVQE